MSLPAFRTTLVLAALCFCVLAARATSAQSPAGSVSLLAVDTDVSGNTPTSTGSVEVCTELEIGEEQEIDVVVEGIPEVQNGSGGLLSFQFDLVFDERYLHVVAFDMIGQMLGAAPGSNVIDGFTDDVPNETGSFLIAGTDFGTNSDESGDGVLVRLTVRGVGAGTSDLALTGEILVTDSVNNAYEIGTVQNALLAVGVTCDADATPPPPPPTGVPTSPPSDGESPGPTGGNGASPNGSSGSPVPGDGTASPGGNGGETTQPGDPGTEDDDDDGGVSSVVIIAGLVALLAIAGAVAYFIMRQREEPTV